MIPSAGDVPSDDGLSGVVPRWAPSKAEHVELGRSVRAVTVLDEAVALGAPFVGARRQVLVSVPLTDVDAFGLPTAEQRQRLRPFEQALAEAVEGAGRLVATLSAGGVREYVLYVTDAVDLGRWHDDPPPGTGGVGAQVLVLDDPAWLGLRELAGLLQPGEQSLDPLAELPGPGRLGPDLPGRG